MSAVDPYLEALRDGDATVLYLRPEVAPVWRVADDLVPSGDPLPGAEDFDALLLDLAAEAGEIEAFREADVVEFACDAVDARFVVQIFRAREGRTAVIRSIPAAPPAPIDLRLSNRLQEAAAATSGVVLLCGPRRSGRTTAIASLLQSVGNVHDRYIVSVERPVEYRLDPARSIVHQLRVGTDTPDFAGGIRAALSAGADVIAVGAVEDTETARLVVKAADAGVCVLAVVTATDLADGVERFIELLPAANRGLHRSCLAQNLELAFYQYLLDGVLPVCAWLADGPEVRDAIRLGRIDELRSLRSAKARKTVKTLDDSLEHLARSGALGRDRALRLAADRQRLEQRLPR